jgi:hypothetical protein
MLVRFHSKTSAGVLMFGDIAVALLRLMGMSGSVPGAVLARDIPEALGRLRQAVESAEGDRILLPAGTQGDEADRPDVPRIKLRTRAYPLIQMLEAAAAGECDVIWEEANKATG